MLKKRLVMGHRFDRLPMLVGVLQYLVARHDTAVNFIEDHMLAKFDQRAANVSRNVAGMRLKDPRALVFPEATFLPSSTRVRVWVMTRSTRGSSGFACSSKRRACTCLGISFISSWTIQKIWMIMSLVVIKKLRSPGRSFWVSLENDLPEP